MFTIIFFELIGKKNVVFDLLNSKVGGEGLSLPQE